MFLGFITWNVPLQRSPSPLERLPYPLERSPYPLERSPYPSEHSPYPLERLPCPLERLPNSREGSSDPFERLINLKVICCRRPISQVNFVESHSNTMTYMKTNLHFFLPSKFFTSAVISLSPGRLSGSSRTTWGKIMNMEYGQRPISDYRPIFTCNKY